MSTPQSIEAAEATSIRVTICEKCGGGMRVTNKVYDAEDGSAIRYLECNKAECGHRTRTRERRDPGRPVHPRTHGNKVRRARR